MHPAPQGRGHFCCHPGGQGEGSCHREAGTARTVFPDPSNATSVSSNSPPINSRKEKIIIAGFTNVDP
jgi:hypothetical protein